MKEPIMAVWCSFRVWCNHRCTQTTSCLHLLHLLQPDFTPPRRLISLAYFCSESWRLAPEHGGDYGGGGGGGGIQGKCIPSVPLPTPQAGSVRGLYSKWQVPAHGNHNKSPHLIGHKRPTPGSLHSSPCWTARCASGCACWPGSEHSCHGKRQSFERTAGLIY